MGHFEKPIIKVEPLDEPINSTKVVEDTEVDIMSWTNKGDFGPNKVEDPDALVPRGGSPGTGLR